MTAGDETSNDLRLAGLRLWELPICERISRRPDWCTVTTQRLLTTYANPSDACQRDVGNYASGSAYMADITDLTTRTKGMGAVGAANNLGGILGPVRRVTCGYNLVDAFVGGLRPSINHGRICSLFAAPKSATEISPGSAQR